ncbi:hypothetical protein [Methylocystis sp. ATCC 49242]|uniref:hypothetical protein n=1 Tax=Methylocystis sp. ATCC 49242 TaxID=622637 RepID=UPI0001F86B42|nr:hypothetical protein [Methylocystis sp. ATCC 49242]
MSAPNKRKARRANAGQSHKQNNRRTFNTTAARGIEPAYLQRVAQRLHACGPRVAFEFIADLARGRDFAETLADFARIDPAIYAAVAAIIIDGGRA